MDDARLKIPPELQALLDVSDDPHRGREFFQEIIRFADRAGLTDSQLYNTIGLNRSLWYRLRDDKSARTKKSNVLKLVIALRLNFWEAFYLIALAGYSFTPGIDETDRVVASCLLRGDYDPEKVDRLLDDDGLETLFAEK